MRESTHDRSCEQHIDESARSCAQSSELKGLGAFNECEYNPFSNHCNIIVYTHKCTLCS